MPGRPKDEHRSAQHKGTPASDAAPRAPVPTRYRGVWARRLLQTPAVRDDTTFVRWLQTGWRHADLRVPVAARAGGGEAALALQQGFAGITQVDAGADGETCHWHRRVDFQPPGLHPDAGRIVFETPDRMIETGVHADYLEVWERLPGSAGLSVVLEQAPGHWLLQAGGFAMRVRPSATGWPPQAPAGCTLAELCALHPALAAGWLGFEISFGHLDGDRFHIERSTLPALDRCTEPWRIERVAPDAAVLSGPQGAERWRVLEWLDGTDGPNEPSKEAPPTTAPRSA